MLFIKKLLIVFVCLAMFIGTPLLNLLGYPHTMEGGAFYFKIHPATYIILFAFAWYFICYRFTYALKNKIRAVQCLVAIICITIVLVSSGRGQSISFVADTLLASILFVIIYPEMDVKMRGQLQKIILIFYIFNCLMAVYEKAFNFNFFPVKGQQFFGFRASALQGHPLNNGLITATIMAYIYIYDIKRKYVLLMLGLISLVCFGSRGALYGIVCCTTIFVLGKYLFNYKLSRKREKSKSTQLITTAFIVSGILFIIYLITNTKFGERLMDVSFFDEGSAGVRLDVLNILRFFKDSDILWGAKQNQIDRALFGLDVLIIENFWIIWLLRFGLILMVLWIIPLIRMMYARLLQFKIAERLYILGVFFVVASTNNSLATNTMALNIFFICSFAFGAPIKEINTTKIRVGL